MDVPRFSVIDFYDLPAQAKLMRHYEKRTHLLAKLGEHMKAQRITVFAESHQEFSARLMMLGAETLGPEIIEAMENGDATVPIGIWMSAWQAMQVSDAVVKASKSDAVLYLASTKPPPGIEEEMATHLNKKSPTQ